MEILKLVLKGALEGIGVGYLLIAIFEWIANKLD